MNSYVTKQNDVLDQVVNSYYGDHANGIVELVLEANQGLADYGPILPAGLIISLPDRPQTVEAKQLQKLWD